MARSRYRIVAIAALLLTPFVAWLNASFADQDRGHPADWMAAALFFIAAAVATRNSFLSGRLSTKAFLVGMSCLLASAGCMAVRTTYGIDLIPLEFSKDGVGLSLRMVFLALISGALALSALTWPGRKPSCLIALSLSALVCIVAANQESLLIIYSATPTAAALCYFAIGLGTKDETNRTPGAK